MLPFSMGYVQVDGADTTLPTLLHMSPREIFIGKRVKFEFVPEKERKGDLMDVYAVPAIQDEKAPEWSCMQKDREQMEALEDAVKATQEFIKVRYNIDNSPEVRGW
jgi:hypothetical protein